MYAFAGFPLIKIKKMLKEGINVIEKLDFNRQRKRRGNTEKNYQRRGKNQVHILRIRKIG